MTTTLHLSVPDISCGHCKTSIEGALLPLGGVTTAEVDIDAKEVAVTFADPTTRDDIVSAIEGVGYDVAD